MLKPKSALSLGRLGFLFALSASCAGLLIASQPTSRSGAQEERSNYEKVVPYVPTPPDVVEKMLELAKVGPEDVVYDLGSGDGRIVIMAAQKFGAQAVGVELDDELYKQSSARIKELGLDKRAKIIHGNLFEANFRPATVVTLYLLTSVNEKLRPYLEKQLSPGTRVVSHDFKMPGWSAEKMVDMTSQDGVSHTIYLYIRP